MNAFTLPSVGAQVETLNRLFPKLNHKCLGKALDWGEGTALVLPNIPGPMHDHVIDREIWNKFKVSADKRVHSEIDSRVFDDETITVPATLKAREVASSLWGNGDFYIINAYSGSNPNSPGDKASLNHRGYSADYARHVMSSRSGEFPLGIREGMILTLVSSIRFEDSGLIMILPGTIFHADEEDKDFSISSCPGISVTGDKKSLRLIGTRSCISNRFAGHACGTLCNRPE